MQTHLSPEFIDTPEGEAAADILSKCVHCGFCNATCPTYQLLGDELDGPRGRIYLIKQMLEGAEVTRSTQLHLDRCLTCLNCQTTCPSGVEYGHLVDIGRTLVEARVERPPAERAVRWLLKEGLTSPLFAPAMQLGQALRPLLPKALRNNVPAKDRDLRESPPPGMGENSPSRVRDIDRENTLPLRRDLDSDNRPVRRVLMLRGCVQPSMMPSIDIAAARVLAAAGIEILPVGGTGCCGALRTHLSDHEGGLADMRRNIDAWHPTLIRGEADAIVSSASACGLAIKEYAHALAQDPEYAQKAARISAAARDLSELLPQIAPLLMDKVPRDHATRVAVHSPCTLQHGQGLRGGLERYLSALGFEVAAPSAENHLCCGSAGTYSILQPELSAQLRDRKLSNLVKSEPQTILSANMGCIKQLQSGTSIPVRHWIEALDSVLTTRSTAPRGLGRRLGAMIQRPDIGGDGE